MSLYHKPSTIIKFREGIEITLYTKTGKVQSILTALYGEIFQETGEMLFKDSVCLKNMQEKQSLLTEELHWNQNTQAIFTPKNVIVRSEDGSLFYGDGIKTSLDFKQYEFIRPKGKFKIGAHKMTIAGLLKTGLLKEVSKNFYVALK